MKSKVFKIAHQIRNQFSNFSTALKAAWRIVKMEMGIKTPITFAKKDGELRDAVAIGCGSLITLEKGYLRFVEILDDGTEQWRSFRIKRLVF